MDVTQQTASVASAQAYARGSRFSADGGAGMAARPARWSGKTQGASGADGSASVIDAASADGALEAKDARPDIGIGEREDRESLESAVRQVEEWVAIAATDIAFTVSKTGEEFVVQVLDRETKEVVRQVPSEEMLAIARALDKLQGVFLRSDA